MSKKQPQTIVRLTIREAAESIQRQTNSALVPDWKFRRVVDDLDRRGLLSVQRIGIYRTVADTDLHIITDELRKIGWLHSEPVVN